MRQVLEIAARINTALYDFFDPPGLTDIHVTNGGLKVTKKMPKMLFLQRRLY